MSFKSRVTLANSKIRIFDKLSSSLSTCMQVLLPKRCQFRAKKNPKSSWQLRYLSGHIATLLQPKKGQFLKPRSWKTRSSCFKTRSSKAIWTCLTFSQKKMESCGVNDVPVLQLGWDSESEEALPKRRSTTIRTKKNIDMKEWKAQMEQTGLLLVSKLKL